MENLENTKTTEIDTSRKDMYIGMLLGALGMLAIVVFRVTDMPIQDSVDSIMTNTGACVVKLTDSPYFVLGDLEDPICSVDQGQYLEFTLSARRFDNHGEVNGEITLLPD